MTYEPHKMDERAALTSSKTVAGMIKQGATDHRSIEKMARILGVSFDGVLAQLQHVLTDAEAWRQSAGRSQELLTHYRDALAQRDPWEDVHTIAPHGERRCWFCHATKTMGAWDDPPEKGHAEGCLWLQAVS